MEHIKGSNVTSLYIDLIKRVSTKGVLEGKTRDLMGIQLELTDPRNSILFQKKYWKWCFQELFDRMSGIFGMPGEYANPGLAYNYRPAWKRKLAKEEGRFHYAYGECYNTQVPAIIKQLKRQKTSREAIINVWNSNYLEYQPDFNRRPCTLTLHFLIRDKKVNLFVNMRTNDVINLLPFDIFHHTFLQRYVAHVLKLEVGTYYHFASHMYYPKKREREGRNYLEKLIFNLENSNQEQYEYLTSRLRSHDLEKDFTMAYPLLYEGVEPVADFSSDLIGNLVNFILDRPVKNEFSFLQSRKY